MDTITTWIKNNMLISVGIGIVAIIVFLPKLLKGIFGTTNKRIRHHRIVRSVTRRRSLPSSVGIHRRMKGAKKPWQIKGSLAARRHMAQIRKRR
jgi:hypothetical protein